MAVKVLSKIRPQPQEPQAETRRHHLTREEEADRCLNHTTYSRGAQLMTGLIFLAVVFGVPITQHVVEIRQNLAKRAAWDPSSGEPKPGIAPKIYDVVSLLPTRQQISDAKGFWGYWSLIPSADSIGAFESSLKQTSVLTEALLSPAQNVLTRYFGVGNEKAYVGREGWLFYRPDVEYLTTDGFLSPKHLLAASHASDIQPDPVKAIFDFKRQLAARNITLIVMPMSTKPMIHPEMLVGPDAENDVLQNSSFSTFVSRLEAGGVPVYDPTPLLLRRKKADDAKQYLETDTHWTPEAMDAVAGDLTGFINARVGALPRVADPGYREKDVTVSNLGDIAEMLKLPAGQTLFRPQTVRTQQVTLPDGSPWAPQKTGDVLLLGDSFSNIYSLEGMNWGTAAGFAEHLSYWLHRPLDTFLKNSGGAFASRLELARAMRGHDRLAGKRVVVYEFSMRDLAEGDWKMITLPTPPHAAAIPLPPPSSKPPVATPPTPLKVLSVTPASFDPTKGQSIELRLAVPKGEWKAQVLDQNAKAVAEISGGKLDADGTATAKWDGRATDGKPVAPGAYTVSVAATRPDGQPVAPVTTDVTVTGPPAAGKLESLGAHPNPFDPASETKTKIELIVPAPGRFAAEVRDGKGKLVRRLESQRATGTSLDFAWDGKDASNKPVADGAYKVRVRSAEPASTLAPIDTTVTVKSKKATPPAPTGNTGGQKPGGQKPGGAKPTDPTGGTKPAVEEGIVVTARIVDRSNPPAPGSVPYKDCLIELQLTDVHTISGKVGSGDIAVFVYGMRDNSLVDGAFVKGGTIRLRLTPWDKAPSAVTSINQMSLDAADSLTTYYGERK